MDPRLTKPPVTKNLAGGPAYDSSPEAALASYAGTGMFGSTYYADAKEHTDKVRELALACDNAFLASAALYAREQSKLKDMPAFLTAMLAGRPGGMSHVERIFPRTIDNAKQLRTFAQIIRSGTFGRKNLSSRAMRRIIGKWFESRTADQLFRDSIGGSKGGPGQPPRLEDVWYAARAKPRADASQLMPYLRGKTYAAGNVGELVNAYELFKSLDQSERKMTKEIASLPFQLLDSLKLNTDEWRALALFGGYKFTIKNLNTFVRHGCVDGDDQFVDLIAHKLAEHPPRHVYPYEVWMALKFAEGAPDVWKLALSEALDKSLSNIPTIHKNVILCPDVSASMRSPISGARGTATSKAECIDVAALMAAGMAARSEGSLILPFDTRLHYDPFFTGNMGGVAALTKVLASYGGGGTDCALPMRTLNSGHFPAFEGKIGAVVYISDYESWVQSTPSGGAGYARAPVAYTGHQWTSTTSMHDEWLKLKARNPGCKLVLMDAAPHATTQVRAAEPDVLQIGGFSDSVFDVIAKFLNNEASSFVDEVRKYA